MIDWTIQRRLLLVPPIWLFLRVVDFSGESAGPFAAVKPRPYSGGLRIPSYRGGEIVGA